MSRNPCTVAVLPKGSTLCTGWFFGGPHQWNDKGMPRCSVKRRQKPPYQDRFTDYHEWDADGRCKHCKLTRTDLSPRRLGKARCTLCGLTRYDVKLLARLGLQPRLECQDYGHPAPEPKPKLQPGLRLVAANGRRLA